MSASVEASNRLKAELDVFPGNYISPEQLASVLQVKVRTIYDQIEKGALPVMRWGRQVRIHKHDVHIYSRTS